MKHNVHPHSLLLRSASKIGASPHWLGLASRSHFFNAAIQFSTTVKGGGVLCPTGTTRRLRSRPAS